MFISSAFDLKDSLGAKANFHEVVTFSQGSGANGSTTVFINTSQTNYAVTDVACVFSANDANGTVDLFRDRGTAAPGAGASVLSAAMSGAGANNTVVNGAVLASGQAILNPGDRLSVKEATLSGTLAGLCVTARLTRA
jgi:hypothetical protein